MVFILLIAMILLFVLSYKFIDNDFLSPINLYLLFSLVSIIGMLFFYEEWELSTYGVYTVLVYIVGSVFFMIGCSIAKGMLLRSVKERTYATIEGYNSQRINIGLIKIIIIVGVCVVSLVGTYTYLKSIGGLSINSLLSLGQAINRYRYMRGAGSLINENARGAIWNLISYLSRAFAYYCIFIMIKNAVNKAFKPKDLLYLIPFITHSLECLMQSNRGGIIQLFFATIISWFISSKYTHGWDKTINSKAVRTVFKVAVILVPIFFGSLILMGRYNTLRGFDFRNYSIIYLSGGIRNLDLYLKDPISATKVFGEETFVTMHKNLYVSYGIGEYLVRYLEFRSIGGDNIGNIYTSYRRFIHDFGFSGIVIFPLIQGLIISALYYGISRSRNRGKINFPEVFYCFISYTIIYIAIDDLFFTTYFSITGIKLIIIFFIAYFFIFNITSEKRGVIKIFTGRLRITRNY